MVSHRRPQFWSAPKVPMLVSCGPGESVGVASCGKPRREWRNEILLRIPAFFLRPVDFISKISDTSSGLPHPSSTLARLFRHIGRALSGLLSRQQTLLSLILFAPSVHAKALDHPTNIPSTALSYNYWIQALHNKQAALASLWTCAYDPRPQRTLTTSSPTKLLLACFLCTSSLALFTHTRRKDPYQSYIIAFCAVIATVFGAMRTVDIEHFIFIHLFWGCVIGAGGSALFHHFVDKRGPKKIVAWGA